MHSARGQTLSLVKSPSTRTTHTEGTDRYVLHLYIETFVARVSAGCLLTGTFKRAVRFARSYVKETPKKASLPASVSAKSFVRHLGVFQGGEHINEHLRQPTLWERRLFGISSNVVHF